MIDFSERKRVVFKVGTAELAYKTGGLNIRRVSSLVTVLSDLKNSGKEIALVTSGAVGVGMGAAGFTEKPRDMPTKQALAAIGQCELMRMYVDMFGRYNHTAAQILMTRDVISNPERRVNITNTFGRLFELNVLPIINANDSVSISHLDFDENDTLSATVARLCGADLLVLLTDVDGLYNQNPKEPGAKLIPEVGRITTDMIAAASGGAGSDLASGGMLTKLEAAQIASEDGIPTVIINGKDPGRLYDLFENKAVCTLINANRL